jgi:hypothetical protein
MEPRLKEQLIKEINAINGVFARREIMIRTEPGLTHIAGDAYIVYEIDIEYAPGFNVAKIEDFVPNLQEALSRARQQRCPITVRYMPLSLVVDHPFPQSLRWNKLRGLTMLQPGQMLAGRSYLDPAQPNEIVDLALMPQVLIAGTTGSGKSTLQVMMVLTLMASTSPRDMEVHVIDLKNEDLVDLAGLPHVVSMAVTTEQAIESIDRIYEITQARRESGRGPYKRVVLVIDELAQLSGYKETLKRLGLVVSIGRSKNVNVLAAVQKPTADILSSLGRGNFPLRFAGRVTDSTEAYVATGRRESGAELLMGAGAFLRIGDTPEPRRMQAYKLDPIGIAWLREAIFTAWGRSAGQGPQPVAAQPKPPAAPAIPPALVAVFEEKLQPDGTFVYGGMTMALRVLYGADAPTQGRAYQDAKARVEELIKVWKSSNQAQIVRLPLGKSVGKTSGEEFPEEFEGSHNARPQGAD